MTSRTSSFAFKGSDKSISEIAELVGVGHVLEGSVRKAGNRIRVTAQLIEAQSGFHLWSETYDRTLDDIFAVQDEISAAIVASLEDKIIGRVEAPVSNRDVSIEAYDFYLLGQQRLNLRTQADLEMSRTYFTEAIAIDPDYAAALAGVASAHLLLSDSPGCYGTTPIGDALDAAKPFLDRAIDLTPSSAKVNGALSFYYERKGDFLEAKRAAQLALASNPSSSTAIIAWGQAEASSGDPSARIITPLTRALELDPLSIVTIINLVISYTQRQRYEEAQAAFRKLQSLDAPPVLLASARCIMLSEKGQYKDIIEILWNHLDAVATDMLSGFAHLAVTSLGHSKDLPPYRVAQALDATASLNLLTEAQDLSEMMLAAKTSEFSYPEALALANYYCRVDRCSEALDLLSPYAPNTKNPWGNHFALTSDCMGARLYLFCLRECGDNGAKSYLEKLKNAYLTLESSAEGAHYITPLLGAIVATYEGDHARAVEVMERRFAQTLYNADTFLRDPNLKVLHEEPGYIALRERVDAHFARERQAAQEAGVLPIPQGVRERLQAAGME